MWTRLSRPIEIENLSTVETDFFKQSIIFQLSTQTFGYSGQYYRDFFNWDFFNWDFFNWDFFNWDFFNWDFFNWNFFNWDFFNQDFFNQDFFNQDCQEFIDCRDWLLCRDKSRPLGLQIWQEPVAAIRRQCLCR